MKEMLEALVMKAVNVLSSSLDRLDSQDLERARAALSVLQIWLRYEAAMDYNTNVRREIRHTVDLKGELKESGKDIQMEMQDKGISGD